jgi:hypothetical protein
MPGCWHLLQERWPFKNHPMFIDIYGYGSKHIVPKFIKILGPLLSFFHPPHFTNKKRPKGDHDFAKSGISRAVQFLMKRRLEKSMKLAILSWFQTLLWRAMNDPSCSQYIAEPPGTFGCIRAFGSQCSIHLQGPTWLDMAGGQSNAVLMVIELPSWPSSPWPH